MRKLTVHLQTTLDEETAYVNQKFNADTWVMSRRLYEFVVPCWTGPAGTEFAGGAAVKRYRTLEHA